MGKARFEFAPVEACEEEVSLPGYWDELDEEERSNWIGEHLSEMIKRKLGVKVTIEQ